MTTQAEYVDYKHPSNFDQIRFFGGLGIITVGIILGYFMGVSHYALGWTAYAIAAFSVAGNDAIQTVGTFIESKEKLHWFPKALFLAGILVLVHVYGWYRDHQQIHFGRLDSFVEPRQFNLLQLLAPVILVVITRLKAPISTTFLILGLFGSQNVEKMLVKSFLGYGIAFACGILVWGILGKLDKKEYQNDHVPSEKEEKFWGNLQWVSTLYLWIAWLFQDTANIAVFIPRALNVYELAGALGLLALAITIIVKMNGGTIQEVVSEKSDIKWSKAATIVDIVYATVLVVFQNMSKMPMSTTWVFLGLLAGREIILHRMTSREIPYLDTFRKVGKDVLLASLGLAVSISIFVLSSYLYH